MEREKKIGKEGSNGAYFNKMEIIKAFYSDQNNVKSSVKDRVVQTVSKMRGKLALEEERKRDKMIEL